MDDTDYKYTVLLVDDEKLIRFTMSALLKKSEFNVETAESVAEAIELYKNKEFDAVISDILMTPMDGFMLRDLIRARDQEIPIIFQTSLVNGIDNELMSRISADPYSYYIPKNANKEVLINKLKQVTKISHALHSLREHEE